MKLKRTAQAGTVESSDVLVIAAPADAGTGVAVELTSPTLQQYGEHIRALILRIVQEHGVQDARVFANEKGALDYTIEARVKTALARAMA